MNEGSFGEWLKYQRNGRGLTQKQLAQQIGCATITLRKIESGERQPSGQILKRVAEIFNISPNEQKEFLRFARGDWTSAPARKTSDAPWLASVGAPRTNLPASLTSFIGREQEMAVVHGYLLHPNIRIATLTGPPGIGKTRLSLAAAQEVLSDFKDGVFFVALAPLEKPGLMALAIIQALGFAEMERKPPLEQLKDGIGDRQILLVLDNLEHLIDESAALVFDLLSGCPCLKILATSREALRVPGEWIYPVPALKMPPGQLQSMEQVSQYAALGLFVERARAVQPDFVPTTDHLQTVATICSQLDGLPLAIELIAARIRWMSPHALLAKMNDQFILSADGMRAVSHRQKTLKNAISWSYNLLTSEEQSLFAQLSVFTGGFTLDAAEAVFFHTVTNKSVSDLLALLADKSLLQRTLDPQGEPRFNMLMTIQQFARDTLGYLGENAEIRNRHLAYFLNLAEQADKQIHGPDQADWLNLLEEELNNFRTALAWCISNQRTESALRLLGALGWAWDVRGHYFDARNWFQKIRSLPDIEEYPAYYATLLNRIAHHDWVLGDMPEARTLLKESQEIWLGLGPAGEQGLADSFRTLGSVAFYGESDKYFAQICFEKSLEYSRKNADKHGQAVSLCFLGLINYIDESALSLFKQGLDLAHQTGDLYWVACILRPLGWKFRDQGEFQKAHLYLSDALAIFEAIGFKEGIVESLLDRGILFQHEGNYVQAERFYYQSLQLSREYALKGDESNVNYYLGLLSLQQNDFVQAKQHFKEDYRISHKMSEGTTADFLYGSAAVASGLNKPEHAAWLYGAMQACGKNPYHHPWKQGVLDQYINIAREQLGEKRFEELAVEGRRMSLEQAIGYALED